jgi:hypothetical protein
MTRLSTRDSRAPSAPVNRSSPVTSAEWIDYFQRNARSLGAMPWEAGVALTEAEQTAVAGSVPTFQIGETGSGRHLLAAAARYVAVSGDEDYLAALRLFIAEEQRHGADLGRWLDLAGIPRIEKHWTNGIFRRVRQLAGLELMISLLLTAEVMAMAYYAALRKATRSIVLRRLCEQILKDEVAHIRFQSQRLALLRRCRPKLLLSLTRAAHRILFAATALVVWRTHRAALRAGGFDFRGYCHKTQKEVEIAMRLMEPGGGKLDGTSGSGLAACRPVESSRDSNELTRPATRDENAPESERSRV